MHLASGITVYAHVLFVNCSTEPDTTSRPLTFLLNMEREKVETVVVDAVAFFKNIQLQNFAKNVFTVRSVVNEIRDVKTRERLAVLPYDLRFREPSTESIQFVSDFARKTGDYGSLSPVDIQVMALAHQMTKERIGTDHLKRLPENKVTFTSNRKPLEKTTDIVGFYLPQQNSSNQVTEESSSNGDVPLNLAEVNLDEDDKQTTQADINEKENSENSKNEGLTSNQTVEERTETAKQDSEKKDIEERLEDGNCKLNQEEAVESERKVESAKEANKSAVTEEENRTPSEEHQEEGSSSEEEAAGSGDSDGEAVEDKEEEGEDDEVGWITPQNIQKAKADMRKEIYDSLQDVNVACLTTDFAMQNCLIQIGIPVLSVDGMVIKKAKSFVLRCYACFKVTSETNRKFCPKCGNQTLNKASVTVDKEGNTHYHMTRRRGYKVGELRQSIPMPKSGKHVQNPVVCEDQPRPQNRVSRKAMMRNNVFDPDYVAQNSPFVNRDVTSRSALLGVGRKQQTRRGRRK
ncbi:RNA-binding protein NOB1-like isoform X2 [Apostichopus japonicus]|uniref:RNA-binding protein NOB1-like isoform X2 n=1 Tax=Stichopus japonicus TaxID=307972 RepID=UPI003AB7A814